MFSILTATYNREGLLSDLYSSLCDQNIPIQWVVVDDGSTDGTHDLILSMNNANLDIHYVFQENSGKHRALNLGLEYVKNKWVAIIDSDDQISKGCLRAVLGHIERLGATTNPEIAGMIFNSIQKNGRLIGTEFPFYEYRGKTYQYYDKYKIKGDKFDFYKLSALQEFPFPVFDGEKFISESVVWSRINDKYDCYFINEAYQIVEYQSGGLSDLSFISRANSPTGACLLYAEAVTRPTTMLKKVRSLVNYFRFFFHGGMGGLNFWSTGLFLLAPLSLPLGYILYFMDRLKMKRK